MEGYRVGGLEVLRLRVEEFRVRAWGFCLGLLGLLPYQSDL